VFVNSLRTSKLEGETFLNPHSLLRCASALFAVPLLAIGLAPVAQAQSLTTIFASNNLQAGNMFDVIAANSLIINSFDINVGTNPAIPVEVYYRAGSYVGHDTSAAGWTLLGTQTVTGLGNNAHTPLNIGGLVLNAGSTTALYLTSNTSSDFQYTNGTTDYSNADMTIVHGVGKSYLFASSFSPRIWNGVIYYTSAGTATPEPGSIALLVGSGLSGSLFAFRLRRNRK
jgi:hypothetical protein